MERIDFKTGTFYIGDCLKIMPSIDPHSVDMILNDPPYGTTACSWDSIIPLDRMWINFWNIVKENAAIVLFGAEPFSSMLRVSAIESFKYDWIWSKSRALGFTNAKNKPMNKHEIASVFSLGTVANRSNRKMPYFPQNLQPYGKIVKGKKGSIADQLPGAHKFGRPGQKEYFTQEFTNYPTSILEISNEGNTFHPTQKPVALFEYLIKTYTNPEELVLDNTAGSGTTAIAAINANRRWICIEQNEDYAAQALARIYDHECSYVGD